LSGITLFYFGDVARGAGGDYLPAFVSAFGAEVNYPVNGFNNVKVMLNN
jgi:hypothetical protein